MKNISSILLVIALLLIPSAAVLEKSDIKLWNAPLLTADVTNEPNRHTPIHPLGTFLPPTINKDTTYTVADNPIIIAGIVNVPTTSSLTFTPGARVYVHEHGNLRVAGNLNIKGTKEEPVTFTTNEAHLDNRTWNGITLESTSRANIANAQFRYGAPGISCLTGSQANISNTKFQFGNLGIYTKSKACTFQNIAMDHLRDGIIAIGIDPDTSSIKIDAANRDIQVFESPTPQ